MEPQHHFVWSSEYSCCGGNVVSSICGGPDLNVLPDSCGQVINQATQTLLALKIGLPVITGIRNTLDTIIAGGGGVNEIVRNVHVSEPTGQGYINDGIYLGIALPTSIMPYIIFVLLS